MMIGNQRVLELIYETIDELNQTLAPEMQLSKSPETVLFGEGSTIDSLGLVGLIVGVEQRAAEQLEAVITIVNEKAMSLRNSPFRTVGTLADYVSELIQETAQAA